MPTEMPVRGNAMCPSPLRCCQAWLVGIMLFTINSLHAADRRQVKEPHLPGKVCAALLPPAHTLQAILDRCPRGQAVHLGTGRYMSGPLHIPDGVTLWLDKGAVLSASSVPADYDRGRGQCGTLDKKGNGCRPFILFHGVMSSRIVGDGTIDGQGGQRMQGSSETWWQLARQAQQTGLKQNVPRLIEMDHAKDITLYHVHLRNAPGFHIMIKQSSGVTVWGITIDTPARARNTDGVDPVSSDDITITHSFIRTGDDNIAIKAGNDGPARHISVISNHLYAGHGMSIGSETQGGISDVLVKNMTLDGTSSGLRIKSDVSRGGRVTRVEYQNICMRDNRRPIDIDTHYNAYAMGHYIPVYQKIRLQQIRGAGGTLLIRGYDAHHPVRMMMNGVVFTSEAQWRRENAYIVTGRHGIFPSPTGHIEPAPASPLPCRWLPFPITTR